MIKKTMLLFSLVISICTNAQEGLKEKCLTNNDFDDRYASYSPKGDKILFESNRDGVWEIYIMNSDGTSQKRLTNDLYNNRRPSWHPNGKKIVFESNRKGKAGLFLFHLKNSKIQKLKEVAKGEPMFAQFSPDGKQIAIALKTSSDVSNVYLLNRKGKVIEQITDENLRSTFPKWSSKGNELVYFSRKETNNKDDEIYRVNLKTKKEKRLTNWPKHNFCPSWSPDGKKIAYVTSMDGIRPEIYMMDSDGNHKVRLTYNTDGDTLPNWSPDNSKILITAFRNGNFQICELELTKM